MLSLKRRNIRPTSPKKRNTMKRRKRQLKAEKKLLLPVEKNQETLAIKRKNELFSDVTERSMMQPQQLCLITLADYPI